MRGGNSIHYEKEGASSLLLLSREIGNLAAFFRRPDFQGIVGFCFVRTSNTSSNTAMFGNVNSNNIFIIIIFF